jgi:hypothetical protein
MADFVESKREILFIQLMLDKKTRQMAEKSAPIIRDEAEFHHTDRHIEKPLDDFKHRSMQSEVDFGRYVAAYGIGEKAEAIRVRPAGDEAANSSE